MGFTRGKRVFEPRRIRYGWVLWLALCLAAGSGGCGPDRPESGSEPYNVLLITIDTLRADRLGAYGYAPIDTSTLDGLAASGVRFEHAYAPTPITLPSHVSIMTGIYPPTHGVRNNGIFRLSPSAVTLAEKLKEAGYRTEAVISAYVMDACFGLDRGFDRYDDQIILGVDDPFAIPERKANEVTDLGLARINQLDGKPFFLWLHYYDPHAIYRPPRPYLQQYRQAPYDGEVAFVDDEIGRLLEGLKKAGLEDNTLVVVTSDHGEGLGDHRENTHGVLVYDTTLHVPLILYNPRLFPSPHTLKPMVSLLDIAPTLFDLLGIALPDNLQGRSLVPLLEGRTETLHETLYFETLLPYFDYGWAGLRGIRTDRYKYTAGEKPELFDLQQDPREERNTIAREARVARGLEDALNRLVPAITPEAAGGEETPLDEETQARLAALGYSSGAHASRIEGDPFQGTYPGSKLNVLAGINRAAGLCFTRDYETALKELEKVVVEDPRNRSLLIKLASVCMILDRLEQAKEYLGTVLTIQPESEQAFNYLGQIHHKNQEYQKALVAFQQSLRINPSQGQTHYLMALAYAELGKIKKAMEELHQAIASNPNLPKAHNMLGNFYRKMGDHARAVEWFKRVIVLDPDFGQAYKNCGSSYFLLKDYPRAAWYIDQALERKIKVKPELVQQLKPYWSERRP